MWVSIGVILGYSLGLDWDNGKETGNYFHGSIYIGVT